MDGDVFFFFETDGDIYIYIYIYIQNMLLLGGPLVVDTFVQTSACNVKL